MLPNANSDGGDEVAGDVTVRAMIAAAIVMTTKDSWHAHEVTKLGS